jgi:phosphatidylglycerophosphate synthase
MAPNLVTLVGLIINLTGALIYLPEDLTFTKKFPWYMYFYSATASFIYQTLDAVDGKQARRTGTSSPLGQLFDHGKKNNSNLSQLSSTLNLIRL